MKVRTDKRYTRIAIIGNGFDIQHGLQSKYSDFVQATDFKVFDLFKKYYIDYLCDDDQWNSFEEAIEKLSITCYHKQFEDVKNMENVEFDGFDNIPDCYIMLLDEYNRFNGTSEILGDEEILLYSTDNFYTNDTMTYMDTTYDIKGVANHECLNYITNSSMSLFSKLLIVVPNQEVFDRFLVSFPDAVGTWIGFDEGQKDSDKVAFAQSVQTMLEENGMEAEAMVKHQEQEVFFSMYGGILFVGGILGVMFILCTVMIIYYKQISEGYEDKERFLIMQKVGLSKEEIKSVIHSQIMMVFFLPLATAVVHSAVALRIVASCLRMVVTVHMPTFILSVALTCILFSLVYMVVYKITSKEYYNIVNA